MFGSDEMFQVTESNHASNKMKFHEVPSFCKGKNTRQGMALHSSLFAWRIPMDKGAWRAAVHGVTKSQTQLSNSYTHTHTHTHGLFKLNIDLNG